MTWMETERAALVETFRRADPDAPTLCEGWTVRHVLAHLVQREHHPVRQAADVVARARPGRERFLSRLVERARTPAGYAVLLETFAAGMSPWNPVGWPGDRAHHVEYVIHHEDVRRGRGPVEPRVLSPDQVRAIWAELAPLARLGYLRSPVGVVHAVPGGPRRVVKRAADAVVVVGDPVELALHASGRVDAADVDIVGCPETVERFLRRSGPKETFRDENELS